MPWHRDAIKVKNGVFVGQFRRSSAEIRLYARLDDRERGSYTARLPSGIQYLWGRLAQRESARFTRERSLVQSQYRPPFSLSSPTHPRALLHRVDFLHTGNGLADQFFQHLKINIFQRFDVETGLAGFVFAELGHQVIVT